MAASPASTYGANPQADEHAGAIRADIGAAEMALRRSDWEHPGGRSRAEQAADHVAGLAAAVPPGTRLGTKEDVRARCGVSVGTFNEALRLLQTRQVITVRPGPGGGLAAAVASGDPAAFVHANWQLHAQIAAISPGQLLRTLYSSLLEIIERHTLSVLPAEGTQLPGYIEERYQLHADLVAALERRDAVETRRLIATHNTQG